MTTQMSNARINIVTDEMRTVAKNEKVSLQYLQEMMSDGRVVILKNNQRTDSIPTAVGEGMKVKVASQVGTSNPNDSFYSELDKVRVVNFSGADIVMDLSVGSFLDETRQAILASTKLPVGTVPIYQASIDVFNNCQDIMKMTKEDIFSVIKKHCIDGVDFICVHSSLTKQIVNSLKKEKRDSGIVSEGGAIIAAWILNNEKENPLYEYFDELLEIVKEYDVTLYLSSSLKSGSVKDSFDRMQMSEAIVQGELVERARKKGVQTIVEGLGKTPLDRIPDIVKSTKQITKKAPLCAYCPIPDDTCNENNHIAGAIGGAFSAYYGADLLLSQTSTDSKDTNVARLCEGVKVAKLAAHCADLARNNIIYDNRGTRKQEIKQNLITKFKIDGLLASFRK